MFLLRTLSPWLLLAFLSQQVSLSSGGRHRQRHGSKPATMSISSGGSANSSLSRAHSRSSSSSSYKPSPAASGKGKFPISSDQMMCTWGAKDVGDTVRLSVKCESQEARVKGGVTDLKCEYNGEPRLCPSYQANPRNFWKQVARAFKRHQEKVCRDEGTLIKAAVCKRAPRVTNFKLDISSAEMSAQSGGEPEPPKPTKPTRPISRSTAAGTTACTGRKDRQQKAEETCGRWASVCSFFFAVVQSEDC